MLRQPLYGVIEVSFVRWKACADSFNFTINLAELSTDAKKKWIQKAAWLHGWFWPSSGFDMFGFVLIIEIQHKLNFFSHQLNQNNDKLVTSFECLKIIFQTCAINHIANKLFLVCLRTTPCGWCNFKRWQRDRGRDAVIIKTTVKCVKFPFKGLLRASLSPANFPRSTPNFAKH